MATLLFHRGSGTGYVVEASNIEDVKDALRRARGQKFVSELETLQAPVGGALRVRALDDGFLDVTTAALTERWL